MRRGNRSSAAPLPQQLRQARCGIPSIPGLFTALARTGPTGPSGWALLAFRTGSEPSGEQSVFGVLRQAVVSIGDVQHPPLGLCVSHVFSNSPSLFGAIAPMARTVDERQCHSTMLTISVDHTAKMIQSTFRSKRAGEKQLTPLAGSAGPGCSGRWGFSMCCPPANSDQLVLAGCDGFAFVYKGSIWRGMLVRVFSWVRIRCTIPHPPAAGFAFKSSGALGAGAFLLGGWATRCVVPENKLCAGRHP
jgi:hypothetical protein